LVEFRRAPADKLASSPAEGFKGEVQAFMGDNLSQCFNYTIELDYMFERAGM
jgi:hypothetical protein